MTTLDDARRMRGVGPDADRIEIRAAYRRRIRALHPDLSGDRTPANRAVVAVVEAYQRLQGEGTDSAGLVRRATAVMIALTGSILLLFFLIAFSQSGR